MMNTFCPAWTRPVCRTMSGGQPGDRNDRTIARITSSSPRRAWATPRDPTAGCVGRRKSSPRRREARRSPAEAGLRIVQGAEGGYPATAARTWAVGFSARGGIEGRDRRRLEPLTMSQPPE
jgi:hypothetical protein